VKLSNIVARDPRSYCQKGSHAFSTRPWSADQKQLSHRKGLEATKRAPLRQNAMRYKTLACSNRELELHDDALKRVMTPRTSVVKTVESRVFTRSVCMGVVTYQRTCAYYLARTRFTGILVCFLNFVLLDTYIFKLS
jgi:hypothetical protein